MYSFSKYLNDCYVEDTEWSWVFKGVTDKPVTYRSSVQRILEDTCLV